MIYHISHIIYHKEGWGVEGITGRLVNTLTCVPIKCFMLPQKQTSHTYIYIYIYISLFECAWRVKSNASTDPPCVEPTCGRRVLAKAPIPSARKQSASADARISSLNALRRPWRGPITCLVQAFTS